MDKVDKLELIFRESLDTYKAKNADYGDSFSKSYQEFGLTAPIVRMSDKLERLKSLSKAEARVKDESIKDTLIDLGNYAFMTALELEEESLESSNKKCDDKSDYFKKIINYLEEREGGYVQQHFIDPKLKNAYWICVADLDVIDKVTDGTGVINFGDFYKKEYTEGDKLNI